jgi:hypothetical protein
MWSDIGLNFSSQLIIYNFYNIHQFFWNFYIKVGFLQISKSVIKNIEVDYGYKYCIEGYEICLNSTSKYFIFLFIQNTSFFMKF